MTDPIPSPDSREFWTLREAPLHEMTPAQWQDYYPAMAPWLQDTSPEIRDCAVERLMMAVFRSEFRYIRDNDPRADEARNRTAWLLGEIERAHDVHPDIIPRVLRGLLYHGDDEPFRTLLLAWLDALAHTQRAGVDADLIQGTQLIVAGSGGDAKSKMGEWLALLDHPSDHIRACAANLLGNFCDDDTAPDTATLFSIIGSKELARPGLAGPFWTPQQYGIDEAEWQRVTQWMLDLLEQRRGHPSQDLPYNDIEFYLHELCSHSPELMWRMLHGGHTALALMTATEMLERVDGVQPVLAALATDSDPEIAERAKNHLARFYI